MSDETELELRRWAMAEIAKGEGAYSRDQLEHADNCIESMKRLCSLDHAAAAMADEKEFGS